jgi:hypothetical protein
VYPNFSNFWMNEDMVTVNLERCGVLRSYTWYEISAYAIQYHVAASWGQTAVLCPVSSTCPIKTTYLSVEVAVLVLKA